MYISHLSITNYRNFTSFDIDLKPFTLIIGENNTGKTNLLESLCLIFGQEITTYKKRVLEIDDVNYQAMKKFKKQFFDSTIPNNSIIFPEVKIEVIMTGFNEDQESVVGDWFIDNNLKNAKLTYVFSLRQGWPEKNSWIENQRMKVSQQKADVNLIEFPIGEYEYQIYGGNGQRNRVDPYFLRMLKIELLDALRDAKRELIASGDYRLLYKILNNRDTAKYTEIQKALLEMEGKIKDDPEFEKIKDEIKSFLDRISLQEDNLDNKVGFKFTSPELSEILKKLSLIYGNDPISIERNGLGRNNLLYISLILSHLAGKNFGSDHTFFRVIGIEEPESHLHPHLQNHLSKNIKNSEREDLQIILTSHSPYIASHLDLERTYILYKNSGKIEKHGLLDGLTGKNETIHYLKKFLNATNSVMFFAKKLILVEGISEQILLPRLFEIYSNEKTLEKCGCNIVNVNGLAFKHFLEIIKNGYFIRCVVYTDGDGNNRAADLRKNYESGNDVIKICISSQKTFEKDLIDTNKNGSGKNTFLEALCKTKPISGKKFKEDTGINNLNVESFFKEIEDCKSEFAYNLLGLLEDKPKNIKIPQYIKDGFDHILNSNHASNQS